MAPGITIKAGDFVSETVNRYYSTADVFRKHGIDYCCGAKWSIEDTCFSKHLDTGLILHELNQSVNAGHFSLLDCSSWSTDFQLDFIVNVYHTYFKQALPDIQMLTQGFTEKHQKKYPQLYALNTLLSEAATIIGPWIPFKEHTLFPYLRRMAHAYHSKESYAGLMVRTLQKPMGTIIPEGYETITAILKEIKTLTENYIAPAQACTSHKITFYKLQQFSQNLQHQLYLEYHVLYPQSLAMEKEMIKPGYTGKEKSV